jgi:chromosome transmission fidelity protein 1
MTVGAVAPGSGVRKIIYAARTHSQLSQFIGELRRTAWGDTVRVVHLGGRLALCGNDAVVGARYATEKTVTEHCLDLQKGIDPNGGANDVTTVGLKKRKETKVQCPLLQDRDAAVPTLALHTLAEATDIEEAAALGREARTCAYYASRTAVAAAEVVVLPYSMLLSPSTRDSIGLSLTQAFVIVDEAHNLPEALRNLHSCRLSLPVIMAALEQLSWYTTKYADRLAGRNLLYLGQIQRLLLNFQRHLQAKPGKRLEGMMSATQLLLARKLDNVNLYEIIRYLGRSRLSQKLMGYSKTVNVAISGSSSGAVDGDYPTNDDALSKHVSAMSIVETFLEKLACSGTEGKVVTDWPGTGDESDDSTLKHGSPRHPALRYVLLQPATFFENVLQQASALALVGGTLRPFVHVAAELLGPNQDSILQEALYADRLTGNESSSGSSHSYVSSTFTAFTCDHVVPASNVLLQCLARGATGKALDFRFKQRTSNAVCDELGQTLVQICQTIPSGVVVFLPSYSYEACLVNRWKQSGLWQELQTAKRVHREPKSSQQVELALQSYARDAVKGAVLLSVVGGKMSEGINFSNHMARGVVVVGLPYPDITDPELCEKMATLDESKDQSISGQAYYHNLCMRAVNQSVGRAIRHANDYAAIVLMDQRYTTDSRIWSSLPPWLKRANESIWRRDLPFDQRLSEMTQFFATKKD